MTQCDHENKPPSITHVTSRYPPVVGGLEQVVRSLARHQYQLGVNVRVLTSDHGTRGDSMIDDPFPVTRLKSMEVAHTVIIPGLLSSLANLQEDSLIHLHISSAYVPEMVWVNARLRNVPYLAHVHLDVLPSGRAGILLEPYKKLILRRVLHGANLVIVPTEDYVDLMHKRYDISERRIRVVPNATDHTLSERQRSASFSAENCPQVILVGRLAPQKNIPLALAAVASYITRFDNRIRLIIVGEGEDREKIRAEIDRLNLHDIVTLRGTLKGRDLEMAYAESDLLLMTSLNESFGLVLIEAMTKGLPLVSVDIPGVRNVLADGVNGLLSEPKPEALADAMHKLVSDTSLYESISVNNQERARQFSWQSVAMEMAAIYESLRRSPARVGLPR